MTLDILVCTFNEGIEKVADILLPQRKDVRYVVSFQYTSDRYLALVPSELAERTDVLVVPLPGAGLSRNRNHAISLAQADVAVFADDDVRYEECFFDNIFRVFASADSPDVACFMALCPDGTPLHYYSKQPFRYADAPYGVFFSSCEIAFRPSARLPEFDERFGKGSPYLMCGEEEVFLYAAFRAGLDIRFYPQPIVITEGETTGKRFFKEAKVQRSKGAVLYILHGFWGAFARITKFALCHVDKHRLSIWFQMWKGIRYIQTTEKP